MAFNLKSSLRRISFSNQNPKDSPTIIDLKGTKVEEVIIEGSNIEIRGKENVQTNTPAISGKVVGKAVPNIGTAVFYYNRTSGSGFL